MLDPNYVIPGPPAAPRATTRPDGWPGAPPPAEPPRPQYPVRPTGAITPVVNPTGAYVQMPFGPSGHTRPTPPGPRDGWDEHGKVAADNPYDLGGAKIIARVGPEVILASEVSGYVNDVMAQNAAKIPAEQWAATRDKLIHDRLNHLVEIKLALIDAQRKIPEGNLPKIMESMGNDFEEKELKKKLRQMNLGSRAELDAILLERGTSLEREKQTYIEQQLAFGWVMQQVKIKKEISHVDMLAYYDQHLAEFEFPAKARWEQLLVRVSSFPNRAAARRALEDMGNDVWRGANLADVARAKSQGSTAPAGGQFDWTCQGSMASAIVDRAIFTLPPGRLSPILEDERSLSIVRVHERTAAGRATFADVQEQIKEKLEQRQQEKMKEKVHEYVAKLREETPIWTAYDDAGPTADVAAGPSGGAASTSLRPTRPAPGPPSAGASYRR